VSKTTENIILAPGEAGWEIWTGSAATGYSLQLATASDRAADLTDLPGGEILLLFPVRAVTAVPMRVTSDDDALFPDLAALHAERLGLRPDPMAGQLTDVFVIAREAENTALVSILLRTPGEGDIPPRGPKSFDISSRAYPVTGETLAVWKEFGRWVFAIFHAGNLVYCQATSDTSASPDETLAREIRLALMQLSMQGMEIQPTRTVVWTSSPAANPAALQAAFGVPVEITPRPAPVEPNPVSKLLPADVRAARRAAQQRRNIIVAAGAVAAVYVGLLGWAGYGLWRDHSETRRLLALADAAAPEGQAYALHIAKWDELSHALEIQNAPVDILNRVARSIPPNSGLRLRDAEISANEVRLIGEAPQYPPVSQFSLALNRNNELASFQWQTPEPNQSTRGWEFVFTANTTTAP
jgi:hypothetical protein